MADTLTRLVADALSRAAADPAGLPLYAGRSDAGLFPATSAAKPAAKRCLDDGLLEPVPDGGKREVCRITPKGTRFLLDHADPKQVLEDFVRTLEARQTQADQLLAAARRAADELAAMRATLAAVLPQVDAARVATPANRLAAVLDPAPDVSAAILTRLGEWSAAAAARDCPLPDLYRMLGPDLTVGAFHDALRRLHAAGRVYLHPWTGPLYALPEPCFALLVGHNVAFYASVRP